MALDCSEKYTKGILEGLSKNCPTEDINEVLKVIGRVVTNIILPAVGVLFVIMIILGGLQYVTSGGNTQKAEAAKKTLTFALVGMLVIILSEVIIGIFTTILGGAIT